MKLSTTPRKICASTTTVSPSNSIVRRPIRLITHMPISVAITEITPLPMVAINAALMPIPVSLRIIGV
ncbi:hypothetical protein D3C73_1181830 [compost metagenome]